MGRLLGLMLLGFLMGSGLVYVGMVIERVRGVAGVTARERRKAIRAAARASRRGHHGEAELWEKAARLVDEPR